MSRAELHIGDVFDVLATLEPGSVDLVMSSPPFLALRSYLPADHPDKAKEIGSEATPGAFIDTMLDVVEACARVLAPHGSLVFELGDTYAGSGGAGGDYNEGGLRDGVPGFGGSARAGRLATYGDDRGWPLDKSKVLIPQLFAVALAYGFNPLTGRQTEPWRVRNTVAWCRPNPPVGRDGDKFRPATSFLTVACKARDRYWDGDAVRVPYKPGTLRQYAADADDPLGSQRATRSVANGPASHGLTTQMLTNPAGAPLLDWWNIPTAPYKGSHYATYPPDLVVPIVKAMCPARVCRVCGKPSTRITETSYEPMTAGGRVRQSDSDTRQDPETRKREARVLASAEAGLNPGAQAMGQGRAVMRSETLGWSDCACICEPCARWKTPADQYQLPAEDRGPCTEKWRTGVVLDPFAGSGTTLQVATGHGRDAIGIDLDERNADLARERLGMFLTVIEREAAA